MLPLPFKDYIPTLLRQNITAKGQAFIDKVDDLLTDIKEDILEEYFLKSPLRTPSEFLIELDFLLKAEIKNKDSELTQRLKIRGAVKGHKERGLWATDVKLRIDGITGLNAVLYGLSDSEKDEWLLVGDNETCPSDYYWSSLGYDGLDLYLGIGLLGEGDEVEIPGNVYINCHESINVSTLTSAQILQIIEDLDKDIVPSYFKIFLGYENTSGIFVIYIIYNDWTIRTSAADNYWRSICYGNGLFVTVAYSGTGNRVMTSPDGITWTIRTSAADNEWLSVCYGNGLFVAVSSTGTGDRVMTSPDGITWTIRTSAADNDWLSICYGNGLFVAVAYTGTGNRVMTSPDGITWTIRTSAADNDWMFVCYGNGIFVAVAMTGTGDRVMTSPDGITWTIRTSATDNDWWSICYGNGLFVAVASTGSGNRVMTSPDGITWTIRTSAADNQWRSVCYGNGLFVAVAYSGTGNRVMTSTDGITWTIRTSAADNLWWSICYGNDLFVAVARSGAGDRVMTTTYPKAIF